MILVVDDDRSLLAVMRRRLEDEGHSVMCVASGAEALSQLAANGVELMLLDLRLPDMSGDEVLHRMAEQQCAVPFVAMTGHGDERVAVDIMKRGACDFLMKDGAFWELLPSVVRRAIEQAAQERRLAVAEASLRESQRMLSTLMSNLPGMAYRRRNDADWTMEFVSEGCFDVTGYVASDLECSGHVSYAGLIHPDDQSLVLGAVQAALRDRTPYQIVYRIRTAEGADRWVWEQGRGVYADDGSLLSLEGFITDITDRKRAEEELVRYRDRLEELVEHRTRELEESREQLRLSERLASLGTLAAGVAHEINNPVGMILLTAQNALRAVSDPAVVERALREIEGHSHRCGRIVKSLLQFARQEPNDRWAEDLNRLVARAVDLTRRYADEHGAVVTTRCPPGLPAVTVNPLEIEQVFVNLIRNAVEAGDEGVRVLVATEKTPAGVRAIVQDNGRGMTHEQRKRVFDPFYTTRRHKGGAGLGMSIVHGIIAAHGGTIDVESELGYGTLVTIELPGEAPSPKEAEDAASACG